MLPSHALIGAIAFTLVGLLALLPLAKLIPARLDAAWRRDAEAQLAIAPSSPQSFALTFKERAALTLLAAVVGSGWFALQGITQQAVSYSVYLMALVLLVSINLKHQLMPDAITLPIIWIGLVYFAWNDDAKVHVFGAALGYMGLWTIAFLVKAVKGIEILGHGDMKVMAMSGAWFGMSSLPSLYAGFIAGAIAFAVFTGIASRRKGPRVLATGPAHLCAALAAVVDLFGA